MKKLIILIIILGYSMPSWAKWQGMQVPLPTIGDKYFVDLSSLNERFINSTKYSTVRVLISHSTAENWVNYQKLPYGKQIVQSELYDSGHLRGIEAKWEKVQFL
jgi:hypothetical protein